MREDQMPPRPVTVFAALGPNPAPLTELIWALHREGAHVTDAFVVLDDAGHFYLHGELLDGAAPRRAGTHGALHALRAQLGVAAVLHETVVEPEGGGRLDVDDPAHAELYHRRVWDAAQAAVAHAGAGQVVFALCGGRLRTTTALTTMAIQLLARPQDRAVDVRVSDARAEGATGFYFPTQDDQALRSRRGEPFVAGEVDVRLTPVRVPRLRELLPASSLVSYEAALEATQAAVDAAALPRLVVDLEVGEARVDGVSLGLSRSALIWYAALAVARREAEDGWLAVAHLETVARVMRACASRSWSEEVQDSALRDLLRPTWDRDDLVASLAKLRSATGSDVRAWCATHRPRAEPLVAPELSRRGRTFVQRLPLPPDRVEIRGGPGPE